MSKKLTYSLLLKNLAPITDKWAMNCLLLILTFLTFQSGFAADLVSLQHEEDIWENCDLTEVSYPAMDATEFIKNMTQITSFSSQIKPARINYLYDLDGKYIRVFYDKNSDNLEPKGYIIPRLFSTNFLEAIKRPGVETFSFNDAVQDLKNAPPKEIDLTLHMMIPAYLEQSGVTKVMSVKERYDFAQKESTASMDYRERINNLSLYILIEGVLYNRADAGNYIWAAGMRHLGFSYSEIKAGSEINAFFNTREQNGQDKGIILLGDSKKDQAAIKKGFDGIYGTADAVKYYKLLEDFGGNDPKIAATLLKAWIKGQKSITINDKLLMLILNDPTDDSKLFSQITSAIRFAPKAIDNLELILERMILSKQIDSEELENIAGAINATKTIIKNPNELFLKIIESPGHDTKSLANTTNEVIRSKLSDQNKRELFQKIIELKKSSDTYLHNLHIKVGMASQVEVILRSKLSNDEKSGYIKKVLESKFLTQKALKGIKVEIDLHREFDHQEEILQILNEKIMPTQNSEIESIKMKP